MLKMLWVTLSVFAYVHPKSVLKMIGIVETKRQTHASLQMKHAKKESICVWD